MHAVTSTQADSAKKEKQATVPKPKSPNDKKEGPMTKEASLWETSCSEAPLQETPPVEETQNS